MSLLHTARRCAVLLTLVLSASVLAPVGAADAALGPNQQPRFARTIGGAGTPGVFAWGVQYNPVTQEVLVGDYLNFKIRRYDKQGNALGDFYRDDHVGQPYSIAVDPNDGAIYVAELKDNPISASIAKYDKFGNFLYDADASLFTGSGNRFQAFYPVWMTVEEDTGDVWVLDSHYQNIGAGGLSEENPPRMVHLHFNDADQTVTELPSWPITPPGTDGDAKARIYGIDITNDDKIYMTDAYNRRAYIYNRDGTYVSTFAQTQTGGDNRSVAVNEATDRVYIVDAQHSDIDVFHMDGSHISSFGSEGNGPGQFSGGGRQIDIDDDGNLWVGDFGGFEVEKFSPDGTPLLTAPNPARKPPAGLLAQPRDVAIDDSNGDVWVADAWAQRFQRFSSTGASLGAWGERGPGGAFNMNYPRHIAVQPATATTPKRIWVVNERGHHLQVYNAPTTPGGSPTYVRQVGQIGGDDTDNGHFRWPGDVEFYTRPDGTQVAVISDRMASSVKVINARTFEEIDMTPGDNDPDRNFIPISSNGTAIDPATGNIYVGNGTRIRVYSQDGAVVATYGTSGTGLGQFKDIADLAYCNGLVYAVDEQQAKVTAMSLDGTFLGRWGQSYGQEPYAFRNPAGIDCDAQGRVYIADSGNDRIQVFDTNVARTYEPTNPNPPTVTSPVQSAVLPLASVTMTGTATDNVAVGNVEVSVQDADTGLWWNSLNASWESDQSYNVAAWTAGTAPATSVSWRFVFPGVSPRGRYLAEVRTVDHNSNKSQPVVRSFAMSGATPPPVPPPDTVDITRPDGRLTFPAPSAALPLGTVHFTGDASDDVGVGSVRLALKDKDTGLWWTGTGSSGFSSTYKAWDAMLETPGGPSTTWSWDWTPRRPGSYSLFVDTRDAAGNADSSKPNVSFTVTSDAPDSTPPDAVITAPSDGAAVPAGTVTIAGTASDDQQVAGVRLTVRDDADKYWTGSEWSTAPASVYASVGAGSTTAAWSYAFTGGSSGNHVVSATAIDASGNEDSSPSAITFVVDGTADTAAPSVSVTSPSQRNATHPLPTVTIAGEVSDDVAPTSVKIAIQDTVTKQWWTGSGWGTFRNLDADLAGSGAARTWAFDFTPGDGGKYGYQVFAVDGAGNTSAKSPWRTVILE